MSPAISDIAHAGDVITAALAIPLTAAASALPGRRYGVVLLTGRAAVSIFFVIVVGASERAE